LFHQSSLYLKNIVLSVQLLFKKSYLHFSPGGKSGENVPGGNVLNPTIEISEIYYSNNQHKVRIVDISYNSIYSDDSLNNRFREIE